MLFRSATEMQMKMFLTRMGSSARFIITGDTTQIDLPARQPSGLLQALRILKNTPGIAIVMLDAEDVIRHHLVKSILSRYDEFSENKKNSTNN